MRRRPLHRRGSSGVVSCRSCRTGGVHSSRNPRDTQQTWLRLSPDFRYSTTVRKTSGRSAAGVGNARGRWVVASGAQDESTGVGAATAGGKPCPVPLGSLVRAGARTPVSRSCECWSIPLVPPELMSAPVLASGRARSGTGSVEPNSHCSARRGVLALGLVTGGHELAAWPVAAASATGWSRGGAVGLGHPEAGGGESDGRMGWVATGVVDEGGRSVGRGQVRR